MHPSTARPERLTHFVAWDTRGARLRRAICGRLIHISDESPRPTCADCLRVLEAIDYGELEAPR